MIWIAIGNAMENGSGEIRAQPLSMWLGVPIKCRYKQIKRVGLIAY
jgi:hypothetical protein